MERHVLLVGGGLHSAVMALGLLDADPSLRVTLVERDERLGGNHTWCFHGSDVTESALGWLGGLVCSAWPSYEVRFPKHTRRVDGGYFMVSSERLHEVVSERFEAERGRATLRTSCEVRTLARDHVVLGDGSALQASVVLDARGPGRYGKDTRQPAAIAGYQKFVGLELQLEAACPQRTPLLMDARLPQTDGFRFMYLLPLTGRRVLLEDTYYADGPALDPAALSEEILAYASHAGLRVQEVLRREHGVLPLPSRMSDPIEDEHTAVTLGYGGGLFHPTTGYSFPLAVQAAEHARSHGIENAFDAPWQALRKRVRRQQDFCCLLNRMLFQAVSPEARYGVLERFYTLPVTTIERFYALQLDGLDRARIVCGKPPAGLSLRSAALRGAFA